MFLLVIFLKFSVFCMQNDNAQIITKAVDYKWTFILQNDKCIDGTQTEDQDAYMTCINYMLDATKKWQINGQNLEKIDTIQRIDYINKILNITKEWIDNDDNGNLENIYNKYACIIYINKIIKNTQEYGWKFYDENNDEITDTYIYITKINELLEYKWKFYDQNNNEIKNTDSVCECINDVLKNTKEWQYNGQNLEKIDTIQRIDYINNIITITKKYNLNFYDEDGNIIQTTGVNIFKINEILECKWKFYDESNDEITDTDPYIESVIKFLSDPRLNTSLFLFIISLFECAKDNISKKRLYINNLVRFLSFIKIFDKDKSIYDQIHIIVNATYIITLFVQYHIHFYDESIPISLPLIFICMYFAYDIIIDIINTLYLFVMNLFNITTSITQIDNMTTSITIDAIPTNEDNNTIINNASSIDIINKITIILFGIILIAVISLYIIRNKYYVDDKNNIPIYNDNIVSTENKTNNLFLYYLIPIFLLLLFLWKKFVKL